jgi:hypothetical protein
MVDSVGLKFDAERNLVIGSRQQMEAITRLFNQQLGEGDDQ